MKIGLKQEEEEERIVVNALLDSEATRLVMSEESVRKHRLGEQSWRDQYM